eukprot:CAMPEP_0117429614 /NCGR_PEP_ID=MMETSP0758-20121206/9146_1 /TAXON_ID=63605 /ORGANISM="Percolomonas cosmopolitus, Strain AE-1 (ATCC 50343)" /LENGTH=582 /DNA_ID=CAMNT_0005216795 /DNA_START=6 /DNA_END=1751 /DNA_ORIENTATION=-
MGKKKKISLKDFLKEEGVKEKSNVETIGDEGIQQFILANDQIESEELLLEEDNIENENQPILKNKDYTPSANIKTRTARTAGTSVTSITSMKRFQPGDNRSTKHSSKINVGDFDNNMNVRLKQQLNSFAKEQVENRIRIKDYSDRATVEHVIDQRTRMILYKLINTRNIECINGCVSTGKEANVYYAVGVSERKKQEYREKKNQNITAEEYLDSKKNIEENDEMLSKLEASNKMLDPTKRAPESLNQINKDKEKDDLDYIPQLALKIYKTSSLSFKDRERYISGEYRFRHGYSKTSQKMVRLWAEKELRNLKKLEEIGVPVPHAYILKQHVLVMDFIGKDGWPAKRLKNVALKPKRARRLYVDVIKNMRRMYQEADLVHGDLSEYNMLYHKKKIWIIDVSQSVSSEHPNALVFLRKDCENIKEYFRKNHITNGLTTRELFEFITDINLKKEQVDSYLDYMLEKCKDRVLPNPTSVSYDVDERVFQEAYIPRNIREIGQETFERFQDQLADGTANPDELLFTTVTGMRADLKGAKEEYDYEEREVDEEGNDEEDEEEKEPAVDLGKKLGAMDRKTRKQLVKEM